MNQDPQTEYSLDYHPTLPEARLDELSYLITQEVMHRLKGKSMREFAEGHDFDAPQVSRWLRGVHNLSLKSIAKLEAALGEPLIAVCGRGSKVFAEMGLPTLSKSAVVQRIPIAKVLQDEGVKHGDVKRDLRMVKIQRAAIKLEVRGNKSKADYISKLPTEISNNVRKGKDEARSFVLFSFASDFRHLSK